MSDLRQWHDLADTRRRTPDGRGLADARLLRLEDGPGRGQRLIIARNAAGVGIEIAVDRAFDLSALTWRGINLGWNSPVGMPFPPHPPEGDAGLGFMRNFDGFLVTCGLDHIGAPVEGPGDHFGHRGRSRTIYPLHGRVSALPARLVGYGVDLDAERPIVWASGIVRQANVLGEVLELRRRIELDIYSPTLRIGDRVRNAGYRPSRHAMLYHFNLGYPLLDDVSELVGDYPADAVAAFRATPPVAADDAGDAFKAIPLAPGMRRLGVRNPRLDGGVSLMFGFDTAQFAGFGLWSAFQSGTYTLSVEPSTATPADQVIYSGPRTPHFIEAGETRAYDLALEIVGNQDR